ncbi:hypothetical protein OG259_20645 [Streptomyces sp. NBC_00250]|uniref:hypothetical protein n=1 Tax=Streptomyces sp. NBC_00250 TaxID=2903641 RepID=UPI002E2E1D20|nr:hypothetical protein [Streptomyces sp. NBC_00250]
MSDGNEISRAVADSLRGVEDQPAEVRQAVAASAAAAAVRRLVPLPAEAGTRLWTMLVGTLCVILLGSVGCLLYAALNKMETDMLFTVFSSSLSGLIGLFVPPPTAQSDGSSGA